MKKDRLRGLLLISLFAAVISVCSVIAIPFTVPFTLCTLGIFTALNTLGGLFGGAAVMLYIFIGAVGLPVYSGFMSGVGHIMGASGGFILGYAAAALIYLLLEKIFGQEEGIKLICSFFAQAAIYLCGTLWFVYVYGAGNGFFAALTITCLPFILPDAAKIFVAHYISKRIRKLNYIPKFK